MFGNPKVLALFASQHWVASTRQLRVLGVRAEMLRRAVAAELVEEVAHGVCHLTSAPLDLEGRCVTLLLQAPAGSFISGLTAGVLHGLRRMPVEPVEVSVLRNVRRQVPEWARVVQCSSAIAGRDTIERDDGIVVASPLRTLFRLAATCNQFRFERAAEDMWHRGLVSPGDAAEYLSVIRRSGREGVARMERWLDRVGDACNPSESGLEQDLLALVTAAGLPVPVRQHPLRLLNGDVIHIDLAWPAIRFGLEPGHSWWHGGDLQMRSDHARDRACTEVGWHVVRFDEVTARRHDVAVQVAQMYRQRALLVTGQRWPEQPNPPSPPAA